MINQQLDEVTKLINAIESISSKEHSDQSEYILDVADNRILEIVLRLSETQSLSMADVADKATVVSKYMNLYVEDDDESEPIVVLMKSIVCDILRLRGH